MKTIVVSFTAKIAVGIKGFALIRIEENIAKCYGINKSEVDKNLILNDIEQIGFLEADHIINTIRYIYKKYSDNKNIASDLVSCHPFINC